MHLDLSSAPAAQELLANQRRLTANRCRFTCNGCANCWPAYHRRKVQRHGIAIR